MWWMRRGSGRGTIWIGRGWTTRRRMSLGSMAMGTLRGLWGSSFFALLSGAFLSLSRFGAAGLTKVTAGSSTSDKDVFPPSLRDSLDNPLRLYQPLHQHRPLPIPILQQLNPLLRRSRRTRGGRMRRRRCRIEEPSLLRNASGLVRKLGRARDLARRMEYRCSWNASAPSFSHCCPPALLLLRPANAQSSVDPRF